MPSPDQQPLKFYPVVVGINRYRATTLAQSFNLTYAVRDAQRVAKFLRAGNPAFQVVDFEPFLDEQATAESVRRALRNQWGSQRLGKGDVLFFYFAGHGMVLKGEERAFLCCYDTNFRDPNSGGLRLDDLYGDMQRGVSAETVIVILDACYSGSIVAPGIVNYNPTQQLQAALSGMLPQTISHRIILSSAHADQKAREKEFADGGSGVFTHALLEGWGAGKAARANNGLVTPHSLVEHLQQEFAVNPKQKPMTVVVGEDVLVLGRFEGAASSGPLSPVPEQPARPITHPPAFNPTAGRQLPMPPTPIERPSSRLPWIKFLPSWIRSPSSTGKELLIVGSALLAAVALLTGCVLLVIFSPFFFAVAFGAACLVALISIVAAGRAWIFASLLSVIQAILLVGVAHQRFGLAAGFKPFDFIDQFAWVAICIFFIQLCIVLYHPVKPLLRR